MNRILLAIVTMAASALAGAQEDVRLPDIGSSASTLLSPDQEGRIGEQLLREMRGYNLVIDDPLLCDYLESLGYRLVAQSDRPEQPFTFFLVRADDINAFAAPGGYVGVHAGLITTAETESELAAVLAHEAVHVTQRHLVRAFENIKNASIPIMLAMLGAIIAAQSAGSGDAAQAAIVGGTALMQQKAINFTRHNEHEADRIGIGILHRAGYEPAAMATFFGRLGRAMRANGEGAPEFLRTHPVTTTRISEAKDRATSIAATRPAGAAAASGSDHERFLLFRERTRVLGTEDPAETMAYYMRVVGASERPTPAQRYGLALAQSRSGHAREARKSLEALVEQFPGEVAFALALAEAEQLTGHRAAGIARLKQLVRERPGNHAVALAYAEQLVATGERESALAASDVLRPLLADDGGNPLLQLTFARASELAGDEIRAGEAHAEVALLNGRFDDALGQLNNLLQRKDVDYYQRARIEARIAEITPIALEQRRRAIPDSV